MSSLDRFFSPRSVAVIDATASSEKIGGRALRTLLHHGFRGPVYPVNPTHPEIAGLKCYKRIGDVPEQVDLALIALPAAIVADTVDACADAGIKGVVIYSSGFGEAGGDGARLQQRL